MIERLMTEIGSLQALVAELTLTINNNSPSTLHCPSPATSYENLRPTKQPPHNYIQKVSGIAVDRHSLYQRHQQSSRGKPRRNGSRFH